MTMAHLFRHTLGLMLRVGGFITLMLQVQLQLLHMHRLCFRALFLTQQLLRLLAASSPCALQAAMQLFPLLRPGQPLLLNLPGVAFCLPDRNECLLQLLLQSNRLLLLVCGPLLCSLLQ